MRQSKLFGPLLIAVVLFVGLFVSVSGQVDVSNFSNIRTDGFTRADTYVRSGTYAQVGTFLRFDPATVITYTSGQLTPLGTWQRVVVTTGKTLTNVAVLDAGTVVVLENTGTTVITFTDSAPLTLGGTRALGQYDNLTLFSDGTRWIEQSFTNN